MFKTVLGLTAKEAESLREMILQAASSGDAVSDRADEFGQRFQLDFEAVTPVGRATVRSAWIIRAGEDFPRLTTCYVLPK